MPTIRAFFPAEIILRKSFPFKVLVEGQAPFAAKAHLTSEQSCLRIYRDFSFAFKAHNLWFNGNLK